MTDTVVPIIYVYGFGNDIVQDQEDGTVKVLYNQDEVKAEALKQITANKDVIIDAIVSQDWSAFRDTINQVVEDMFGEIVLDSEGKPQNNTRHNFSRSDKQLKNRAKTDDYKELNCYMFRYDWRLDPTEIVEDLRIYIERVLNVTGASEYALMGRCLGCNIALTYVDTYKDERITDLILYAGAQSGAAPVGELFSGRLQVNADSVEQFIYTTDFNLDIDVNGMFTITDEVLRSVITSLNDNYTLEYLCWAINNAYGQIYTNLLPDVLLKSYASFPGYWSMVSDEYYEDAKDFVFNGKEEEYSTFIEKIDNYHYNITNRLEEIIKETQERGTEVSNLVKYGYSIWPISENSDHLSDGICFTEDTSFGATCSLNNDYLSDEYLTKADENGTSKYISPDKRIDASTSLLPDTTWFISNNHHNLFTNYPAELAFAIVNNKNFTVFSDERFPQYLTYDKENDQLLIMDQSVTTGLDNWYKATDTLSRRFKPLTIIAYKIVLFFSKLIFSNIKT